jgi:hypothetical protein
MQCNCFNDEIRLMGVERSEDRESQEFEGINAKTPGRKGKQGENPIAFLVLSSSAILRVLCGQMPLNLFLTQRTQSNAEESTKTWGKIKESWFRLPLRSSVSSEVKCLKSYLNVFDILSVFAPWRLCV